MRRILIAALILLLIGQVQAEFKLNPKFYAGLALTNTTIESDGGGVGINANSPLGTRFHAGVLLNQYFAVEGLYGLSGETGSDNSIKQSADTFALLVKGILPIKQSKYSLFAGLGYGNVAHTTKVLGIETTNDFSSFVYTLGGQYRIDQRFSANLSYLHTNGSKTANGADVTVTQSQFGIGVNYLF